MGALLGVGVGALGGVLCRCGGVDVHDDEMGGINCSERNSFSKVVPLSGAEFRGRKWSWHRRVSLRARMQVDATE